MCLLVRNFQQYTLARHFIYKLLSYELKAYVRKSCDKKVSFFDKIGHEQKKKEKKEKRMKKYRIKEISKILENNWRPRGISTILKAWRSWHFRNNMVLLIKQNTSVTNSLCLFQHLICRMQRTYRPMKKELCTRFFHLESRKKKRNQSIKQKKSSQ